MTGLFRVALSGDFKKADGTPTYPDFDLAPLKSAPGVEMKFLDVANPLRGDQLEDFDALILLTHRFAPESVPKSGRLSVVARFGVGYDTVDVAASDIAPVDTTSSATQTTIDAQRIELVPKGTGFTSLLKTVPGTRPESRSAGFSVDGSSGGENVFVIDGQEVTNYRSGTLNDTYSITTQVVREVQVKSSGFDAEFGGATGGVISVVTRGGANTMHGEFGLQFEPADFQGLPRPLLQRFTSGSVSNNNFVQTSEYFQPSKFGGTNFFPTANFEG